MNQQTYYGGRNEFRWEYLPIGQGHYFLASSIQEAINVARGNAQKDVVVVQQWKPTRGRKYFIKPSIMLNWGFADIVRYYQQQGYDSTLISNALRDAIDVIVAQRSGQLQGNPRGQNFSLVNAPYKTYAEFLQAHRLGYDEGIKYLKKHHPEWLPQSRGNPQCPYCGSTNIQVQRPPAGEPGRPYFCLKCGHRFGQSQGNPGNPFSYKKMSNEAFQCIIADYKRRNVPFTRAIQAEMQRRGIGNPGGSIDRRGILLSGEEMRRIAREIGMDAKTMATFDTWYMGTAGYEYYVPAQSWWFDKVKAKTKAPTIETY